MHITVKENAPDWVRFGVYFFTFKISSAEQFKKVQSLERVESDVGVYPIDIVKKGIFFYRVLEIVKKVCYNIF